MRKFSISSTSWLSKLRLLPPLLPLQTLSVTTVCEGLFLLLNYLPSRRLRLLSFTEFTPIWTCKNKIMSWLRRIDLIEPYQRHCPSLFLSETSFIAPRSIDFPYLSSFEEDELCLAFDHLFSSSPSSLDIVNYATDLIRIDEATSFSAYKRIQLVERLQKELLIRRLSDRVNKLESRFDRLLGARITGTEGERKYTWTSEIKGPEGYGVDRKYKWTADIKGKKYSEETKRLGTEKNYKWTAEIKDRDEEGAPIVRTYTFKSAASDVGKSGEWKKEVEKKKGKKAENCARLVEIEQQDDHRAALLRLAFSKRRAIETSKGKKKELSPLDAAISIQMGYRAYLVRRSQALRAIRDLAVAKSKLKEIRSFFNNFSYRRRIDHDSEERQRFSEKIIVLLLTVDSIEGIDLMVRSAKRSMLDELEAMLDVVDPQPIRKSLSMRRRTFDIPSGSLSKELAAGVAEVVQLLDHEEKNAATLEACL